MVSHDRYFLERVTDQQYAILDTKLRHLPGGVEEYLRRRQEQQKLGGTRAASDAVGAQAAGLSGGERRTAEKELAAIERRIAKLDADITAKRTALADHDQADFVGLGAKMTVIGELEAESLGLEERWLELSEQLE